MEEYLGPTISFTLVTTVLAAPGEIKVEQKNPIMNIAFRAVVNGEFAPMIKYLFGGTQS